MIMDQAASGLGQLMAPAAKAVTAPLRALAAPRQNIQPAEQLGPNLFRGLEAPLLKNFGDTMHSDIQQQISQYLPKQTQSAPIMDNLTNSINEMAPKPAGISDSFLNRVAKIESGGNPNAISPTGAKGLYQFIGSTWKGLGVPGSPMDPVAAKKGMMKFTKSNQNYLQKKLGRSPDFHEMYMAHNLGPFGATRLINADPNALVTRQLIKSNPAHNPKFLMNKGRPVTAAEAIRRYRKAFEGVQ